jgi:hypothetical protein
MQVYVNCSFSPCLFPNFNPFGALFARNDINFQFNEVLLKFLFEVQQRSNFSTHIFNGAATAGFGLGTAVTAQAPQVFDDEFRTALSKNLSLSDRERLGSSLYNDSYFEQSPESRFLPLVMAIEVTIVPLMKCAFLLRVFSLPNQSKAFRTIARHLGGVVLGEPRCVPGLGRAKRSAVMPERGTLDSLPRRGRHRGLAEANDTCAACSDRSNGCSCRGQARRLAAIGGPPFGGLVCWGFEE